MIRQLFKVAIIALLVTTVAAQTHQTPEIVKGKINGTFVGIQSNPTVSPDEPQIKWFHENTLVVRDNELVLDKVPFTVERGKKFYSASDGGFTTYRGRFVQMDGRLLVQLRMFQSDYVAIPVGKKPYIEIKAYPVGVRSDVIEIDGVQYKRQSLGKRKHETLLHWLETEHLEPTGTK